MSALNMDFNMALDFNMNMARSGASVGGDLPRIRANTEDFRKYIAAGDLLIPANPSLMGFPRYWDAELRAYEYLNDFLTNHYGNWETILANAVTAGGPPPNLTPPHKLPAAALTNEVTYILDSAPDRQDRFAEIIGQNSGEGAIGYFLGMLMIDPARMPATNLLIRVARRLGEH